MKGLLHNLSLVSILVFVMVFSSIGYAQGTDDYVEISVWGDAITEVESNQAHIFFYVESDEPSPEAAHDVVAKKVENLIDVLTEMGIERKDIETKNFFIYSYDPGIQLTLRIGKNEQQEYRYRATYDVQVTVQDLSRIGDVITKATSASAGLRSISFSVKDVHIFRERMIEEALKDAQNKANTMARVMGLEIVGISTISETDSNRLFVPPVETRSIAMDSSFAAAATPAPIIPGTQQLNIRVFVVFKAVKKSN